MAKYKINVVLFERITKLNGREKSKTKNKSVQKCYFSLIRDIQKRAKLYAVT